MVKQHAIEGSRAGHGQGPLQGMQGRAWAGHAVRKHCDKTAAVPLTDRLHLIKYERNKCELSFYAWDSCALELSQPPLYTRASGSNVILHLLRQKEPLIPSLGHTGDRVVD